MLRRQVLCPQSHLSSQALTLDSTLLLYTAVHIAPELSGFAPDSVGVLQCIVLPQLKSLEMSKPARADPRGLNDLSAASY